MAFYLDRDDPLSRTLTIAEAAKVAGVTTRSVNRWIADGRLKALVLPGRRRRVVERELLAVEAACHIAAHQGRPGAQPLHVA